MKHLLCVTSLMALSGLTIMEAGAASLSLNPISAKTFVQEVVRWLNPTVNPSPLTTDSGLRL
jgi:hypothetical protein